MRTKTAPTSGTNRAKALVIQPDGKILAAGIGLDPSTTSQFGAALVRYLADGALDPAFGTSGIVVTPVGAFTSGADALALQPDGKVVVAATGSSGPTDDDVVVLRYTPDGVLDPSFGTGGVVNLTPINGEQWARGVAVTATGRILVSARTSNGTMLARLRSTGELDDSFGGTTGVVGIAGVPGEGLVLQRDGKIVVPGMAAGGTLGAARYASTGPADPAFGSSAWPDPGSPAAATMRRSRRTARSWSSAAAGPSCGSIRCSGGLASTEPPTPVSRRPARALRGLHGRSRRGPPARRQDRGRGPRGPGRPG